MATEPLWDELSPVEAQALLESGEALLIDVREAWEWRNFHVPGCVLLSMGDLERRWSELDPERGFERVAHVRGGLARWRGPQEGDRR